MLNQTNTYIPFHIVACSSEERGTQIDLLSTQDRASHNSWESSRVSDFPIEIVLRFHYRSELDYCLIATKQDKNIPDIEFHIGDGLAGGFQDVEYRISGKAENIINKLSQIKLLGIGSYIKLLIKKPPKKSQVNPFGQVSLGVLKFWGRKTAYFTRISNKEIPLSQNKDPIDKILIGLGIPLDLIAWFDEDARNFLHSPIDPESKITLNDMINLKSQSIEAKDFSGLQTLALDIKKVFEIGLEIWKWQRELEYCIAKEDFSRAIELKNKIKRLEAKRDSFDALYETSRYESMIVMKRPLTAEIALAQQLWEEEQSARAAELRRLKELEEQERRRILLEEQERLRLNQDLSYNEKTPGYSSPILIKRNKKIAKTNDDEEIINRFKNPFNFNQGDVDLELYLKPLLAGVGEKLGECNIEILRHLWNRGYLTIFGAKIWNAIHSENWRHREAAAQAVLNFIEMPLPEKYLEGKSKKLFLACMEIARIACEDKILQIYYIGLKILSTALAPPVCGKDVSPKLINKVLKEFTPILINKISELNYRARDISLHTLISIYKHPAAKLSNLMNSCIELGKMDPNFESLFVPIDKQQWRFVLCRLEIIIQIIEEFGYDEKEWNWKEVFELIILPSLFHSNNEIRVLAIEILVALYQLLGEDVKSTVNNVESIKPSLMQQINERFDDVKDIAYKNQTLHEENKKELTLVEEDKEENFESPKSKFSRDKSKSREKIHENKENKPKSRDNSRNKPKDNNEKENQEKSNLSNSQIKPKNSHTSKSPQSKNDVKENKSNISKSKKIEENKEKSLDPSNQKDINNNDKNIAKSALIKSNKKEENNRIAQSEPNSSTKKEEEPKKKKKFLGLF